VARILLIDDDDSFRTMLRLTLKYFGHTVIEACNGKEGLKLFPTAKADLVITDIVMPETEGYEVLRELRMMQPTVKVLVVSGGVRGNSATSLHIAECLGASKAIGKPFANEVLMAAIDELLAR